MKSIISVGSINADFHMRVPKSLSGTEVAKNFMRVPGGKAANVAVFARRIGPTCDWSAASVRMTSPPRLSKAPARAV